MEVSVLSENVFRSFPGSWQFMTPRERKRLVDEYIRARDNYRRALEEGRRDRAALVEAGLLDEEDEEPTK